LKSVDGADSSTYIYSLHSQLSALKNFRAAYAARNKAQRKYLGVTGLPDSAESMMAMQAAMVLAPS